MLDSFQSLNLGFVRVIFSKSSHKSSVSHKAEVETQSGELVKLSMTVPLRRKLRNILITSLYTC